MAKRKPTLPTLTPAERRVLVEKPFPTVHVVPGKSHGGALIEDRHPARPQRRDVTTIEDETTYIQAMLEDENNGVIPR